MVINELYKKTNHYKNQYLYLDKFKQLNKSDTIYDIVNLGSNPELFGFDYSNLNLNGFSLAPGPQPLEYDFKVLRNYSNHLKNGSIVAIPLDPLKFFCFRYDSGYTNIKYYTFLPKKEILNYNSWKRLYISFPLLFHPKQIIRLLHDTKPDKTMDIDYNPMTAEELKEDGKYWIEKCWNPEFDINIRGNMKLSAKNKIDIETNVIILHNMLDYCLEKKFKPVIVLLPVTHYLSDLFPQSFIDNYLMAYIKKANTNNVPVMDYIKNDRYSSPKLYINSFFMNKKGRQLFTKNFIDDLKRLFKTMVGLKEFISNFAACFEDIDSSEFTADTPFQDIDEWTSLIAVTICAMVEEKYGVEIEGVDIRECETLEDLYNLVRSKK